MKVRKGFVSNSSSSSFICEVCGEEASGYDISLLEANMVECVNGHTLCESHVLPATNDDDESYDENDLPETRCPICQMKYFTEQDVLAYALKELGLKRSEAEKQIRARFTAFDAFQEYLGRDQNLGRNQK